ncbi:hypothetical protein WG66_001757 [Moniliophthora roreri]|nr:hypothetical protein WG66_001757 [Moniliophthora roreri]
MVSFSSLTFLAPLTETRKTKEWLVSGGIDEKDIEWVMAWDVWDVFNDGIYPKRNSHSGKLSRMRSPVVYLSHEAFIERVRSAAPIFKPIRQEIAEEKAKTRHQKLSKATGVSMSWALLSSTRMQFWQRKTNVA